MYINKIEELLDKIINNFYFTVVKDNKELKQIFDEKNFVKFQKKLNHILTKFINSEIKLDEIKDVIQNEDNVITVFNIITKYVCYYIFILIGLNYKGKRETYINNIVEFSKNQPSFGLRVPGYFNSESNANTVKYVDISVKSLAILEADKTKKEKFSKMDEYKDSFEFLYGLGQELVNTLKSGTDQHHNIIKIIIIMEMYIKNDKKNVYLILDSASKQKGEYIFIDIVVPKTDFIDFNAIESVLSKKDIDSGYAYEIYDQLTEYDKLKKGDMSINEKVTEIINRRFLTPITEDFMLYHKDVEKYEKPGLIQTKKQKDDTKIRYVVTKVDNAADLYSEAVQKDEKLKDIVEKVFYQPLIHRSVVLINNIEEINIINKLINQGKTAIENNEFYNDLINLRKYPYINYKDFSKDGFNFECTETVDAVRLTSLKANTQSKHLLELRVGSKGSSVNIVGFIIGSNKNIRCVKKADLIDVRKLQFKTQSGQRKSLENGIDATTKFFKHSVMKGNNRTVFWLLDTEKDKVKLNEYIQLKKLDKPFNAKLIVASLHDQIVQSVIQKIYKLIDNKKEVSFYQFNRAINYIKNNIVDVNSSLPVYRNLDKFITFDKYVKSSVIYDKRQDEFPGLYGKITELPSFKGNKPSKYTHIFINIDKNLEKKEDAQLELEKIDAMCQHFPLLDNINAIRRKNPNEFSNMLIEFIYQYVDENFDGDYVCKSCGTLLPIKKYVSDGSYDSEGRFTTLAAPMQVPLEDVPEYEKYRPSIRSIDKLIDRLASITNMNFLVGKSFRMKNDVRMRIVKDVVDTVLNHNTNLKTYFKERLTHLESYGVSKNLTNLFVFELDNNIFVYSSKDKDHYKPIKRNNILVYSLFFSLLELTDTHTLLMGGDRICNYVLFAKVGYNLFDGIKIVVNNKGVTAPIQKYKVLCYLIFYTTCMITKYGMWQTDVEKETVKKFNPQIQKIIIHTLIDFINSFLYINSTKKNLSHMYNLVSTKFFLRLNSLFSSKETFLKIKDLQKARIVKINEQKKIHQVTITSIPLDKYSYGTYSGVPEWKTCKVAKYFIPINLKKIERIYRPTNITNCEDGQFHKWAAKSEKTFVCTVCGKSMDKIKFDEQLTTNIVDNIRYRELKKLALKYCKSGEVHDFIYDSKADCSVCRKCKSVDNNEISRDQVDAVAVVVKEVKNTVENIRNVKLAKYQKGLTEKEEKSNAIIKELKLLYGKTKQHKEDFFRHIDKFITSLESVVGDNDINGINLRYDTYSVDHDHNGYKSVKPFTITDKNDKVQFKKNHQFFTTDVLYYTNNKLQIDVFYNSKTLLLLGYKEKNKEFERSKVKNTFLKVNYSVLNRLKMMGYRSKYIDMELAKKDIINQYSIEDPQFILNRIVTDVSHTRIENLKKLLNYTQTMLYRIKYGYVKQLTPDLEKTEYDMENVVDKYKSLKTMHVKDVTNSTNRVFKDWKAVNFGLTYHDTTAKKLINISVDDKYVLSEEISSYDYHGNLLLFYIVQNMDKLIQYNSNKFVKVNIVHLITDTINRMHTQFNRENWEKNYNMKRFKYVMQSVATERDIEAEDVRLKLDDITTGVYGEYVDPDDVPDESKADELIDDQEEMDAIDVDTEIDYQIDYESGINMN